MKKQSAVEWFIEKDTRVTIDFLEGKITQLELDAKKATFIEQSKTMFEEQIEDAYRINPNNEIWSNSGIDYYNETYGGDK
jgi:hypothetical protein